MAEWSVRRTRNQAVSGSRFPLLPLAGFVLGRPNFKSSAKWLPPASLGFLILLC